MANDPQTQNNLEQKIEKLSNQVEQVKECLDKIGKSLDVASSVQEVKEAVQKLDGFLKLVKPLIWGLVWLILVAAGYGLILWLAIMPKHESQNLDAASLLHNIALLFFLTVAFVSIVWAIVKICQPE